MPPRRPTRQRAFQQTQFKRNKPTKRHFLKNFITQQPKRKRLYAHSQPLQDTNNGTVVRVIIGLLLLHVVVIGGVLLHDQLDKSSKAPDFEQKSRSAEATALAQPITSNTADSTPPASEIGKGRKATLDAETSTILAPVKPSPSPAPQAETQQASGSTVREVTAVVVSPKPPTGKKPTPAETTPKAVIDPRESNKSEHQRRAELRPTTYKITAPEHLKDIAIKFNVSEQELRRANPSIIGSEQLYVGQSIIIPKPGQASTSPAGVAAYPNTDTQQEGVDIIIEMGPYVDSPSTETGASAKPAVAEAKPDQQTEPREIVAITDDDSILPNPPPRSTDPKPKNTRKTISYTIKKGDTLSAIAKHHKMNLNDLLRLNSIPKSRAGRIKPGQKIKVLPKR